MRKNDKKLVDYHALLKKSLIALEDAQAKLATIERERTEPIAVIGVGCRFPGGVHDLQSFWQLLHSGTDAIREVPAERWDSDAYYDPNPKTPGKTYMRRAGFVDDIDLFDPLFFGISPREAAAMDPQQRLLLEVSWEAFEHAGRTPSQLSGTKTGVFVGIMGYDYLHRLLQQDPSHVVDAYFATGNGASFAAGRLSYIYGLQGPSMTLDTVCSSSLVAVHLACQSLRSKEADLALVGGVNLIVSPETSIALSHMGALAPDGYSKAFDASANGYARGEGCGMVVLARLSDALVNRDNILAVIRGTAVNHDGASGGLTMPNRLSQKALLRRALADAKLPPERVSYVETHGTGTSLGDPIEVGALSEVYTQGPDRNTPLYIGALKTNIGHLESAAGIAGLIKTVAALEHQTIPPNLHFSQGNPHIPWDDLPVEVPVAPTPWPATADQARTAGVSSFGMSGTNAHIIVEEAPTPEAAPETTSNGVDRPLHVLRLSAKSEPALTTLIARFVEYFNRQCDDLPARSLGDICFTANTGRAEFQHRIAVTGESVHDMRDALATYGTPEPVAMEVGASATDSAGSITFLFTGQGSQYVGMARQLYQTQPSFRRHLQTCDDILRPMLDLSLVSLLYAPSATESLLDQTMYTQPVLFALEYALAELWRSWGVEPDMVMGHSIGEFAAACIAGVFSLEDGLKLVVERGRLMQGLAENGMMAAILTTGDRVAETIATYGDRITVAAYNGPENIVISGERQAVTDALSKFERQGISCHALRGRRAFHSAMVEPMLDEFTAIAETIEYCRPQIPVVSNLTGAAIEDHGVIDATYWRGHARGAVRFSDGVSTLHRHGQRVFVEIGPHPVLVTMAQAGGRSDSHLTDHTDPPLWLASLRRGQSDWQSVLGALNKLYVHGHSIDWAGFDGDYQRRRVPLPTYPFQRQRYWLPVDNNGDDGSNPRNGAPSSKAKSAQARTRIHDTIYQLTWQQIDPGRNDTQTRDPAQTADNEHWLIFADRAGANRDGIATTLAQSLRQRGHRATLVIAEDCPTPAESYIRLTTIDAESCFRVLQHELDDAGRPYRGIVYLWDGPAGEGPVDASFTRSSASSQSSPSSSGAEVPPIEVSPSLGCERIAALVQAMRQVGSPGASRLWLVTRGAQAVGISDAATAAMNPWAAPLWGLGLTLASESPELWGGLIDLDPPIVSTVSAPSNSKTSDNGASDLQSLSHAISNALTSAHAEQLLAWRNGTRYAARLVRSPNPPQSPTPLRIDSDGGYMITGGFGALGTHVARWLIQHGARHLVLMGRTQIPPRDLWTTLPPEHPAQSRIADIRELESLGARIVPASVDVSDAAAMHALFAELGETVPPIRGIFHTAGTVSQTAPIEELDAQAWAEVFQPKILGSHVLDRLSRQYGVDLLVLFSSISSVWGAQHLAHYAAANAFLDSMAHRRQAQGLRTLSINWGPWAGGGMADEDMRHALAHVGVHALEPHRAIAAMESLLRPNNEKDGPDAKSGESSPQAQALIADVDWHTFGPIYRENTGSQLLNELATADGSNDTASKAEHRGSHSVTSISAMSRADVAEHVHRLVCQVMNLSPDDVGHDQSLTNFGFDSIMSVELKSKLQNTFGVSVAVATLLQGSSVAAIAAEVCRARPSGRNVPHGDSDSSSGQAATKADETGTAARRSGTGPTLRPAWLQCFQRRDNASMRLFCFPYAGGGANIFRSWTETLSEDIELWAIQPPGRGARIDEIPYTEFAPMISSLTEALVPYLDRPFAAFGHCMGTIVMFEVMRQLRREHRPLPQRLFCAGAAAPELYIAPFVHLLPEETLVDALRLINFTSSGALADSHELRRLMLPTVRADFNAVANYARTYVDEAPLAIPITAFGASEDLFAAPNSVRAWEHHTSEAFSVSIRPGHHYFLETDRDFLLATINRELAPTSATAKSVIPFTSTITGDPAVDGIHGPASATGEVGVPAEQQNPTTVIVQPARRAAFADTDANTETDANTNAAEDAAMRLFCFPYAGGEAALFSSHLESLPPSIDVRTVELPGRGAHTSEPPPANLGAVLDALVTALTPQLDTPYALYGHCLGAIAMYELCHRLRDLDLPLPKRLFVAASPAPHLYCLPLAHRQTDATFHHMMKLLGFLAPDPEQASEMQQRRANTPLNTVRADFDMSGNYVYAPATPLPCPITAFGAWSDLWTSPVALEQWQAHTEAGFSFFMRSGDHLFCDSEEDFLCRIIAEQLGQD